MLNSMVFLSPSYSEQPPDKDHAHEPKEKRAAPAEGEGAAQGRRAHPRSSASSPPPRPSAGLLQGRSRSLREGLPRTLQGTKWHNARVLCEPRGLDTRLAPAQDTQPRGLISKPAPTSFMLKALPVASLPAKRPAPLFPAYQSAAADCSTSPEGAVPELVGGTSRAAGRGVGDGVKDRGFLGEPTGPAGGCPGQWRKWCGMSRRPYWPEQVRGPKVTC